MKRLSIILLVLVLISHTVSSSANNLTWINTTNEIVRVKATFRERTSGYCGATMDQDIAPRDMFIQNITNCSIDTINLRIRGQLVATREFKLHEVDGGMFAIRARTVNNRLEYYPEGPYTRGYANGILYLVNLTGYPMMYYSEYHTLLCRTDRGELKPGEVVTLKIGWCETKYIYGYNIVVGGGHANARTVNTYTGRVGNGVFVFRRKAGTIDQFEVVGPFRE